MMLDAVVLGLLIVARYVFDCPCFEWYCPVWLTRWLESGVPDLDSGATILGVEGSHVRI